MKPVGGLRVFLAAAIIAALADASAQRAEPPDLPTRRAEDALPRTKVVDSDLDRVVIEGIAPVPDVGPGAPLYTVPDLEALQESAQDVLAQAERDKRFCGKKSDGPPEGPLWCDPGSGDLKTLINCEIEYSTKASNLALKAADATRKSEELRHAYVDGDADMKAVEAGELARQVAVTKMQNARQRLAEARARLGDVQKILMGFRGQDPNYWEMVRKKEGVGVLGVPTPEALKGVKIGGVSAVRATDDKGDFVRIQGEISNANGKPISIPNLTATLIDEKGFALASTSMEPADLTEKIPAGGSHAFAFDVRPAPELMEKAVVTIAPKSFPQPRQHINGIMCPQP